MGPRRVAFASALITLGLLVVSAGVAAASTDAPGADGHDPHFGVSGFGLPDAAGSADAGAVHAYGVGGTATEPSTRNGNDGQPGDGTTSNGGTDGMVEGSSVGTPPTPVEAPPATASGPAPDAVAAAPISTPTTPVFAPAFVPAVGGGDGTVAGLAALVTTAVPEVAPAAVPEAVVPAAVAPVASASLADLPNLRTIGKMTATADAASGPVELLSSGPGRPIAVVVALLAAALLFLSIHRRIDRGDPKLGSAHTAPDVARFR